MMGGMDGLGWGMGGLGWLFMILFWGLIILGIVVLMRWLSGQSPTRPHEKTPLEILHERYARGEIDQREFEQKKRALNA